MSVRGLIFSSVCERFTFSSVCERFSVVVCERSNFQ